MANDKNHQKTLEDVRRLVESVDPPNVRRRNGRSATERIGAMAGVTLAQVPAEAPIIRAMLAKIRPAAHGMTSKTWANVLSRFRQELRLADVIDPNWQGCAARQPAWAPLVQAITTDKRLLHGLASFDNWCAARDTPPEDAKVAFEGFPSWLEQRTLCSRPRDVVRRVPQLWNEASEKIDIWPKIELPIVSFKAPPLRLQWGDLPASFRVDAEAYLAMRANPDPFDERPTAPVRPLAGSTIQQQRMHLRLGASVLVQSGVPMEDLTLLAELVEPERFKIVLRHYHERANGQPNAFAVGLAITLIQVAHHHLGASAEQIAQLKRIASKLPAIPLELTAKNKACLRQFESDRLRAELLYLPERLIVEVTKALHEDRVDFVKAQVAIAIEFQLAIPLRPQNLSRLNWQKYFLEPDGPKGRLLLHIPKAETKSKKDDFTAEVPDHVTNRLRWYRRHILPRLKADPNGDLFVTRQGKLKSQETLTDQIIKTIERYLGVHMTPHQFRHLAGSSYLDDNPEDTETARALLGHAWSKTTRIYVGSSSRRASRAYTRFVLEQRDALKLKRKRQRTRKPKKGSGPCAS
jgi:integrase